MRSNHRGRIVVRDSSKGASTHDIITATSQLVALTREGSIDPEVTLAILLELRSQLSVLSRLLESRPSAAMRDREQQVIADI